jgi:hypothetical protein
MQFLHMVENVLLQEIKDATTFLKHCRVLAFDIFEKRL